MKPIKKPELRTLKKSTPQQPPAPVESTPVAEPLPLQEQTPPPEYYPLPTPAPDYPLTGSVGNSGWQISDIWRDLRVDGFCD
ncbi:hypothetical protein [Anabaena azotica]|uniref:Uncharacterized protein n=1 Tax=Anabaena azotica FACHB-119 TaxID=947527 RepID=A0ABR8DH44_9NOST|nr:hypothetical protein [Anabaena azotica]MBD2505088.1 hypothetical protein [Anabaena azotica FACHB-119]